MSGLLTAMVGVVKSSAVAEVIRVKKGVTAAGNAQVDTAQSKFGGASGLFDGTGDRLDIGSHSSLAFGTGDFTCECFLRFASRSGNQTIIDFRPGANGFHVHTGHIGGAPYLFINGSNVIFTDTSFNANNVFFHWALVRSSGTMKIYVNGSQITGSYTDSQNYTASAPSIGEINSAFNLTGFGINGHIDEFRISKTARYTANFTPTTTPFVNDANTLLLIHADGTDASTFFEDDVGVRSPKGITAIGNAQVDTAQSKFGGASALFDGSGDSLDIVPSADFGFGTGAFTVEGFVRFSSVAGTPTLWDTRTVGSNTAGLTPYLSSGRIFIYTNTTGGNIISGGTTLTTGVTYHVAVSRDSSNNLKMFLNGVQEGSTYTTSINFGSNNPMRIGMNVDFIHSLNGHIDEFRVSNTARYTTTFTPTTTPFVNDVNTVLLIHADGTDASTFFEDDVGVRSPKTVMAQGTAALSNTQSKFGGTSLRVGSANVNGGIINGADCTDIRNWTTYTGFTVECFVRHASMASPDDGGFPSMIGIMEKNDFPLTWSFGADRNGALLFAYYNGSYIQVKSANSLIVANTMYHVAAVKNGTNIKVYLDGVERATATISGTPDLTTRTLSIGSYHRIGTDAFIDEIRISNSARYTAGFTPTTTPFVNDVNTLLLIHADGTTGSTVIRDDNGTT